MLLRSAPRRALSSAWGKPAVVARRSHELTRHAVTGRSLATASGAGAHQGATVSSLWGDREWSDSTTSPTPSPSASAVDVAYNFSTDAALADRYRNAWDGLRVGVLLEDLDALAGTVAFKHCNAGLAAKPHIVTASVDRIQLSQRLGLQQDMALRGRVVHTGRTSMQIEMRATFADAAPDAEPAVKAVFTFVARDAATGRSTAVPALLPGTEAERLLFAEGAARAAARSAARQRPPEELALEVAARKAAAAERVALSQPMLRLPALNSPGSVLCHETRFDNTMMTFPQSRNTAGKIFGGYLMRGAFELAFVSAYTFGAAKPSFEAVERVDFLAPVEVGDLLDLEAQVILSRPAENVAHVEVLASVCDPVAGTAKTSNRFLFSFSFERTSFEEATLREVLPSTEEDARHQCLLLE